MKRKIFILYFTIGFFCLPGLLFASVSGSGLIEFNTLTPSIYLAQVPDTPGQIYYHGGTTEYCSYDKTDIIWTGDLTRDQSSMGVSFDTTSGNSEFDFFLSVPNTYDFATSSTDQHAVLRFWNLTILPAWSYNYQFNANAGSDYGNNKVSCGIQVQIGYWNNPGTCYGDQTIVYTEYTGQGNNLYFETGNDGIINEQGNRSYEAYSTPDDIARNWFISYDFGSQAYDYTGTTVPIPGAMWLLGSGLIGLVGFRKKFKNNYLKIY